MAIYFFLLVILSSNTVKACSHADAFLPDSTINKAVILEDARSVENSLGNAMIHLDKDKSLPDVVYLNTDKTQFLRLVFYPGNTKNRFSYFEVGYANKALNNKSLASSFKLFETESGVKLGMSKQELLNIKGNTYTEFKEADTVSITYILDDMNKSTFLKRYNMPLYKAKYSFKSNKLIGFEFGFEYP